MALSLKNFSDELKKRLAQSMPSWQSRELPGYSGQQSGFAVGDRFYRVGQTVPVNRNQPILSRISDSARMATQTLPQSAVQTIASAPVPQRVRNVVSRPMGEYIGGVGQNTSRGIANIASGIQARKPSQVAGGAFQVAKPFLAATAPPAQVLANTGIGAGLGALQGNTGKGAAEGFGFSGITRFTNPATDWMTRTVVDPKAGLLARQVGKRGIAGLANIVEDRIIDKSDGRVRGAGDDALSFGIGALLGGNDDIIDLIRRSPKQAEKTLIQRGVPKKKVQQFIERVRKDGTKYRQSVGKGGFGKVENLIDKPVGWTKDPSRSGATNIRVTQSDIASGKVDPKQVLKKPTDGSELIRLTDDGPVNPPQKLPTKDPTPIRRIRFDKKGGTRIRPPQTPLYGALAGIEPETDENGNLTGRIKYNPMTGAAGVAMMAGVKSKPGREALEQVGTKVRGISQTRISPPQIPVGTTARITGDYLYDSSSSQSLKHFTTPESAKRLRAGEAFDYSKTPIHGTGGKDFAEKVGRFVTDGKPTLYLSRDDEAWSTALKPNKDAPAVDLTPMSIDQVKQFQKEGGTVSFNYDTQKWEGRKNAFTKTKLEGVDYFISPQAKKLVIDSPEKLSQVAKELGSHPDDSSFWSSLREKYDVVDLVNVKKSMQVAENVNKTAKRFFSAAKADQSIVLNPSVVSVNGPSAPSTMPSRDFVTPRQVMNQRAGQLDLNDPKNQRIAGLIASPNELRQRGYSVAQLDSMSTDEVIQAFRENIAPFEHPSFQRVQQVKTQGKVKLRGPKSSAGSGPYAPQIGNQPAKTLRQTQPLNIQQTTLPGGKVLVNRLSPEQIIQQARKEIGSPGTKISSLRQKWGDLYQQTVNRTQPIEDLAGKIKGLKIQPENNPQLMVKRLLGAGGVAELRHKKFLQPILNQMEQAKIPRLDMDAYLKARRDVGFGKVGRQIIGSDPIKAQQVVSAFEQKYGTQITDIAQNLYQYQNKNLDMLVDAGFLSADQASIIRQQNPDYVPFERLMDEVDDFLGLPTAKFDQPSSPLKKIKGSERQILSPIEGIIANTYKIESAVSKNNVAKSIANLANIHPDYQAIIKPVDKAAGAISVWENGVKNYYQVPQDVYAAVKGLNEENAGMLVDILSIPAKILRQEATGRNVEFMIPNVFRDQIEAAFNSKYGYRPFIDYFDGLRHWLNYRFGKGDDLVEQWINSGGSMFFESMSGRKAIREQLEDATKDKRFTQKLYGWLISGIGEIGDISEKPTRIGLYKRAVKSGAHPLEAMLESREGTLDFARIGAKTKTLNSLIPFFNVGIQGFDRMMRTVKNNPKAAAAKMMIYAGLPALTVATYNNQFHGEDYARVPDFEKEGNWILMTGDYDREGNPTYIKIPKAHWVQFASAPVEQMVTWMYGNNPQSFSQLALSMFSGALPVLEGGSDFGQVASRTIGGNTPQALKIPIEQIANYDFFRGRNIVPEYMNKRYPEDQFFESTPDPYKKIGDITRISPLRLQSAIEGSIPSIKLPLNAYQSLKDKSNGLETDPNKRPIMRRFYGSYADFDNERPESSEGSGLLERILRPTDKASANSGLFNIVSSEKPVSDVKKSKDIERAKYRAKSDGASIVHSKLIYFDPDSEETRTVDLGKYKSTPDGQIEKIRWEKDKFSASMKIYRTSGLTDEQKQKVFADLKVNVDDLAYYDIASDDTMGVRRAFTDQVIATSKDRKELLNNLASLRREVGSSLILSDSIIDELYNDEIISDEEKAYLKSLKWDAKTGKVVEKPKKKKPKTFKVTTATPKTAINWKRITGREGTRINVGPSPVARQKTFQVRKISV